MYNQNEKGVIGYNILKKVGHWVEMGSSGRNFEKNWTG